LFLSSGSLVAYASDYFSVLQGEEGPGPKAYLDIATKNHVDTIPGWLDDGRIGNAIADLKYTLERFPNHPEALLYMGLVARMTKNPGMAFTYYQNALTQYPQYAITHFQYGQFLMSLGDVDKAIDALKRSIAIEPKLAGGHAGLARAYAKKGDMTKAREAADKARELGFTDQLPPGL
jgi:tetratricopeptide (TPR) repeat protein